MTLCRIAAVKLLEPVFRTVCAEDLHFWEIRYLLQSCVAIQRKKLCELGTKTAIVRFSRNSSTCGVNKLPENTVVKKSCYLQSLITFLCKTNVFSVPSQNGQNSATQKTRPTNTLIMSRYPSLHPLMFQSCFGVYLMEIQQLFVISTLEGTCDDT